jgi:hypothetical protein
MRLSIMLFFVAGAGAIVPGCGDSGPPVTDDPDANLGPEPTGAYTHPEDFPRDDCAPGGFADGGLENIYAFRLDYGGGFSRAMAARIDELGDGALGGGLNGHDLDVAWKYGDDDVILQWEENGDVRAVDLCARADGELVGTYVSCSEGQDPACGTLPLIGRAVVRLDEPAAEGMTLEGEYGADWPHDFFVTGVSVNVRVADEIAYLARYEDGLRIVDAHDPSNLVELGHLMPENPEWGEIYNDVKIVDGPDARRYALMASSAVGVVVVDVTDPATPAIVQHLGTEPAPGFGINTHTLFVDGGKAYLTTYGVGLEIWNIVDPLLPVRLGTFSLSGDSYLHDLYIAGPRAYLNFWGEGMAIVDVSNPADPALLGTFADYGEHTSHSSWVTHIGNRDIAIHGDEQWGAHVHIVDVTEGTPAFATDLAEWETRPEVSAHNIMAMGDLAIMAYYQDGIRVLDLSDPTAPVEVAHFNTWPGYDRDYGNVFFEGAIGLDLDVASRTVYVADSHRGLMVLHLE